MNFNPTIVFAYTCLIYHVQLWRGLAQCDVLLEGSPAATCQDRRLSPLPTCENLDLS